MTITLEESIKQLFDFAEESNKIDDLTGAVVFEKVLELYEARIENTVLKNDGDMLLLQWGSSNALMIDKPTDFRVASGDFKFEDSKRLYLDFTRQVMVEPEGVDVEFDDVAIQMSLTLFYQEDVEEVKLGNMWIYSPELVEQEKVKYVEHEFVRSLLDKPIKKIIATVGSCG